jgi:hypothetical protein
MAVGDQFFRMRPGEEKTITLERVMPDGSLAPSSAKPLVFPESNRNYRVEFDFGDVANYPAQGPPLLLVLELDIRRFRYVALMPDEPGYAEMDNLNEMLPRIGRGARRVITTLDEVELRWPECPLRNHGDN